MQEAVEKFISTWCSVFSAECTDFAPINMKNTHTMCRSDYRLCSIRINYCFPFSSHFDSTNRSQNELTKAILFAHIFTSTEKIPHLYIYIFANAMASSAQKLSVYFFIEKNAFEISRFGVNFKFIILCVWIYVTTTEI